MSKIDGTISFPKIESHTLYEGKSAISFSVFFEYPTVVNEVVLKNVMADINTPHKIILHLRDNKGNISFNSVEAFNSVDATFSFYGKYDKGTTVTFTAYTGIHGDNLAINGGVEYAIEANKYKGLGAFLPAQTNVPLFQVNYTIDVEIWLLQDGVNDDYPFFWGLATRHPQTESIKWLLQENVNDNYPFLEGLATRHPKIKTISNWYYNGKNCVVYLNGKEVSTFLNGKE